MSFTKGTKYGLICDSPTCTNSVPRLYESRVEVVELASQRGWVQSADGLDLCPSCGSDR